MKKSNSIFGNLSLAFLANLFSLFGSTLLTLVLPKFIGITQFSYYQLYIFYTSYIGFFGFGVIEGVYLKHGGEYYEKIKKNVLSAQFRIFSFIEFIFSVAILLFVLAIDIGIQKQTIFLFVSLCIIIYLPRAFLHNLLQTTGKIKEFAIGVIIEKMIHIVITIFGILMGLGFFEWFICAELIGRFFAALYIFFICRDILKEKPVKLGIIRKECKQELISGLSLMISNVASMLIIGVVRQGVEIFWDVETFGKLSLTLSISNLIMTFINSVALVIFPFLKRSNRFQLVTIYNVMKTVLLVPLLGMLILYYPIKELFLIWLPQYSESLKYMAILFPIFIFECKMSVIVNTYLKALRKERTLLKMNSIFVIISFLITFISCVFFHSLNAVIISIVIILASRCFVGEYLLSKELNLKIWKDVSFEFILSFCFIVFNFLFDNERALQFYLFAYIIYLVLKYNDIKKVKKYLQNNIK